MRFKKEKKFGRAPGKKAKQDKRRDASVEQTSGKKKKRLDDEELSGSMRAFIRLREKTNRVLQEHAERPRSAKRAARGTNPAPATAPEAKSSTVRAETGAGAYREGVGSETRKKPKKLDAMLPGEGYGAFKKRLARETQQAIAEEMRAGRRTTQKKKEYLKRRKEKLKLRRKGRGSGGEEESGGEAGSGSEGRQSRAEEIAARLTDVPRFGEVAHEPPRFNAVPKAKRPPREVVVAAAKEEGVGGKRKKGVVRLEDVLKPADLSFQGALYSRAQRPPPPKKAAPERAPEHVKPNRPPAAAASPRQKPLEGRKQPAAGPANVAGAANRGARTSASVAPAAAKARTAAAPASEAQGGKAGEAQGGKAGAGKRKLGEAGGDVEDRAAKKRRWEEARAAREGRKAARSVGETERKREAAEAAREQQRKSAMRDSAIAAYRAAVKERRTATASRSADDQDRGAGSGSE